MGGANPHIATSSVSQDELEELYRHLRDEYSGVFGERTIRQHVADYVDPTAASQLLPFVTAGGPVQTLLDIGCGYGTFVLVAREEGIDAIGIDMASFEIQFARRRLGRARPSDHAEQTYRLGSGTELPFESAQFDVVTLWNVIEHVADLDGLLDEAWRVLKPGGRFFVTAPNYAAFRREAHYHVPWVPFLPKSIGSAYLRLLRRDPRFLQQGIFYCTNSGVRSALRARGAATNDLRLEKLGAPSAISDPRRARIIHRIENLGLLGFVRAAIELSARNPLKASIALCARKPSRQRVT
jgi:MPBQ/MSBQ methyltransferase